MMQSFSFHNSTLPGVQLIIPFLAEDERGYFSKQFEKEIFLAHGISFHPYEMMTSHSSCGVVRGLHVQRHHCQDKLVRVMAGAVYDVVVDLRDNSPTFGQWEAFSLSANNLQILYIPKGFAHGFLALKDDTIFHYLCGDRYDPASDGGILWNDPSLAIRWPLEQVKQVIVSEKDQNLPTLEQFLTNYGPVKVGGCQ